MKGLQGEYEARDRTFRLLRRHWERTRKAGGDPAEAGQLTSQDAVGRVAAGMAEERRETARRLWKLGT